MADEDATLQDMPEAAPMVEAGPSVDAMRMSPMDVVEAVLGVWCTFDYNSYRISSPEFQDLFLVELVTLLFEALFSFLIPNSQHTLRR